MCFWYLRASFSHGLCWFEGLALLAVGFGGVACSEVARAAVPSSGGPAPAASQKAVPSAPAPQAQSLRARAPYHVGWTRLDWRDPERDRSVWVDLWYPAAPNVPQRPQHYVLTRGLVAKDAAFAPDLSANVPVVVLSHGSNGSAEDYAWLSELLAASGFAVLGVNHYGESRVYGVGSLDPKAALRVWERPKDIVFAVHQLARDKTFGPHLSNQRLFALGHSAGGFSVVAAAGARFDLQRLHDYCEQTTPGRDKGCSYAREYGPVQPPEVPMPAASLQFTGLFLMDPALGPSFAPEALGPIDSAARIVAAVPGDFIPFDSNAGYYASHLKHAELTKLGDGEGHFVFLGSCELGIRVFGVALCSDAPGVDRERVHERVAGIAIDFFKHADSTP